MYPLSCSHSQPSVLYVSPCVVFAAGNAPRVLRELEDVYVRSGETAQLECRITGEPKPEITWTKDFQKLQMDHYKYQMKYRDAVALLIIQDVVDADAGRYTAEASNQYGYVATSASVKVKGQLPVVFSILSDHRTIRRVMEEVNNLKFFVAFRVRVWHAESNIVGPMGIFIDMLNIVVPSDKQKVLKIRVQQ